MCRMDCWVWRVFLIQRVRHLMRIVPFVARRYAVRLARVGSANASESRCQSANTINEIVASI